MSVYRDGARWRYRRVVTKRDGTKVRVSGTPRRNTKADAEYAEACAIEEALMGRVQFGRPLVAGEPRELTVRLRVSASEMRRLWKHAQAKHHKSITDMLREELKHLLGVDNG